MTRFLISSFLDFAADVRDRRRRAGALEARNSRLLRPETLSLTGTTFTDPVRSLLQSAATPRPPTAEIDIAVQR
jgi:hypothetical protein